MIFGDSMIKQIKGWELSDEENLMVVRLFPGASSEDMKYVLPTISQKPETILHCGTNDLGKEQDLKRMYEKKH